MRPRYSNAELGQRGESLQLSMHTGLGLDGSLQLFVKVLTNTYSVPLPAGAQVQAKAYASSIELWHAGRCVARHKRCYRRQQQILDLDHYLDILYRKPGALAGSRPLVQKRQAGLWPPSFDRIWKR